MLPVSDLIKNLGRTIDHNSPAILTAISVAGTISTALLAVQATFQAADDIAIEENKDAIEGYQRLPLKGRAALVWPLYIPAVGTGILTIACIVSSNRVSSRRTTALAAAYSMSERAFGEYKEKVIEQIGKPKEEKVRDAVAQKRIDENPVSSKPVVGRGLGAVLCYESMTGRYFNADADIIRKAENKINQKMLREDYASFNEFTDLLGLPETLLGRHTGWNAEKQLEVQISTMLSEGEVPVLHIGYSVLPFPGYDSLH